MLYQQIARNKRKTALIMFIFLVILGLVGAGIGYLWSNSLKYLSMVTFDNITAYQTRYDVYFKADGVKEVK